MNVVPIGEASVWGHFGFSLSGILPPTPAPALPLEDAPPHSVHVLRWPVPSSISRSQRVTERLVK